MKNLLLSKNLIKRKWLNEKKEKMTKKYKMRKWQKKYIKRDKITKKGVRGESTKKCQSEPMAWNDNHRHGKKNEKKMVDGRER